MGMEEAKGHDKDTRGVSNDLRVAALGAPTNSLCRTGTMCRGCGGQGSRQP